MKKDVMNIIDNVKIDDISTFTAADDQVVMVLKDGQEIRFDVMKDSFDRFFFNNMLKRIKVSEQELVDVNHVKVEGFALAGNNQLLLNEIKHITTDAGVDADPADIRSIMLDGFNGRNLLTEAEQEDNLKKYVLIALDKHLEVTGKGGAVHE